MSFGLAVRVTRSTCLMLGVPRRLDNRLTDGGAIFALRTDRALLSRNISVYASGPHFCYRLTKPRSLVRLEALVLELGTTQLIA
jgi:hypothetical protein